MIVVSAACVEVLVSGGLLSEGAATPCGATYTSVGRVTLAKPAPQARTRELRYKNNHRIKALEEIVLKIITRRLTEITET